MKAYSNYSFPNFEMSETEAQGNCDECSLLHHSAVNIAVFF